MSCCGVLVIKNAAALTSRRIAIRHLCVCYYYSALTIATRFIEAGFQAGRATSGNLPTAVKRSAATPLETR